MEERMGYFDGLVDGLFKTDKKGAHLFYPNGILGKGCILPDESAKNRVRKFFKRWFAVGLFLIIGVQVLFGWKLNVFFVGPILISSYFILTRKHLSGLNIAQEKLSYSESIKNSARSHNLVTLILLFLFSICFVGGGLFVMINKSQEWFLGLTCIITFGLAGVEFGRMIKIKIGETKQ
jgi:hypothetical protein